MLYNLSFSLKTFLSIKNGVCLSERQPLKKKKKKKKKMIECSRDPANYNLVLFKSKIPVKINFDHFPILCLFNIFSPTFCFVVFFGFFFFGFFFFFFLIIIISEHDLQVFTFTIKAYLGYLLEKLFGLYSKEILKHIHCT